MTTRRTRTSAAKEGADHDAVAVTQTTVAAVPSSPSASVSPASPWIAPLLCLRSSSFGVAGSVAAKIGLTDEWTEGVVQRIQQAATGATMIVVGSNSSSREMDDDSAALAHAAWIHTLLFYIVRVSFVLLKLYLDGRMLQLFVAAMHASNSLLASTYNQCCAVVLAGVSGFMLFSEPLSPLWLLGASLILLGVACVQWGNSDADDDVEKHASSKGKPQSTVVMSHPAPSSASVSADSLAALPAPPRIVAGSLFDQACHLFDSQPEHDVPALTLLLIARSYELQMDAATPSPPCPSGNPHDLWFVLRQHFNAPGSGLRHAAFNEGVMRQIDAAKAAAARDAGALQVEGGTEEEEECTDAQFEEALMRAARGIKQTR